MEEIYIGSNECGLHQVLEVINESQEYIKISNLNWRKFLEKIGYANSSSPNTVKFINALKKIKDPRKIMEQVLTKWVERQKEKSKLSTLVDALKDIGLIETACSLHDCVYQQSKHRLENSISKPVGINGLSIRQRHVISGRQHWVEHHENQPQQTESNLLASKSKFLGSQAELPSVSNAENNSNKIPISVSGGKRGLRKIKMSIYFVSTIILVSIAVYQVIVLAAHGKLITRLQHLAEIPEQLRRAKNDFVFLSKEMMRTWSDWSQKSSQTKFLPDSANLMPTNNGYLHLHNEYTWPLDPPLQNAGFISEIALVDSMNMTTFFRMLKDTNNVVKLSILNANKCSLDKKQCNANIDEHTHFKIINELHGLRLVSVDKLKGLYISNSLWFQYIIKAFAERISTGNLATLQIKNDAFSPEDIIRLQILLSVNKKTLTTLSISTNNWNSALFSQEFAVISNVHNVFINFTSNELVSSTNELGNEFCRIFPNVKNIISLSGYVNVHELLHIFECESLVSLTVGVKVTRGKLRLKEIVPSNVPRSLKHVRLNIYFSERPCGVIRENEYLELRSFRLIYSSNC